MSDNDLIRRGDALRIMSDGDDIVGPDYPEWFINRYATINAIPAVQPTVKPLVWRTIQDKYDGGREHYGTGAFGHWYCVHRRKSGVWDIVHHVDGKPIHLEPCDPLDAAKAAAQADYEARILSALDMYPTVSPDVAALVEALRFYAWENEMRLPSDGPWGAGSADFGKVARAALALIEKPE